MRVEHGQRLVGRAVEIDRIERMLDEVEHLGSALVIHGEPGIGKSALLAEGVSRARERGMRLLNTTGVQSEANVPFAGLHQLVRPIQAGVDELPAPQRTAMLTAFGIDDDPAPEFFRIALAALTLFADSAARTPILLVAEDAHWLDHATCDVLAFVARRLESDRIVLLAASRDDSGSFLLGAGLPELPLKGLDIVSAGAVLDDHAPDLSPAVRERLLADAAGNPLALVELPLASSTLSEGPLPAWLPLTAQLEKAFASRVSELPAATRALLLVAALNDSDSPAEALAAAALMFGEPLGIEDFEPAWAAGLTSVTDHGIKFRHPLVRSAIHQAASAPHRHETHAALASVLEEEPERAVWHRAASTIGPDDAIAAELEAAADRAQQRGALSAAAAALERSARLTTAPADRGRRLLRAAELAVELGQREMVARLIGEVEALDLSVLDMGRKAWILETLDPGITGDPSTVLALVETADRVGAHGDADLALHLLMGAASNSFWADRSDETHDEIVSATERIAVAEDDPRLLSILAYVGPVEDVGGLTDRVGQCVADRTADPLAMQMLGNAAFMLNAHALATGFLTASIDALREQGRLVQLAQSLVMRSWSEIHLGHWDTAGSDAQEGSAMGKETAQPIWQAGGDVAQAFLAAVRGDEELSLTLASDAERVVLPAGGRAVIAVVQLTRGLVALGAGRHEEAFGHLHRMLDPAEPAHHRMTAHWALVGLAEAAVQAGRRDEARAVLRVLEPRATHLRSPGFRHSLRHARAVLASDGDAETLFEQALAASAPPFERARVQLDYGMWLRRQRRTADARPPLRSARDAFEALGAVPWGERARQELRASGETSGRRSPDSREQLTPQELQIAKMAAAGLSNREIGQKLYLSHRTVGSHLYRAFPKLGITSRSDLQRMLSAAPSHAT